MAYTKDYYHILNLPSPPHTKALSTAELRRAYKIALLAAHPDKQGGSVIGNGNGNEDGDGKGVTKEEGKAKGAKGTVYTVDDIKQAYTTLSTPGQKLEYDTWILHHPSSHLFPRSVVSGQQQQHQQAFSSDFILGLELLDLSDFTEEEADEEEEGQMMQWSRGCRCGADKGFRILEEELGDAEERGEKEVLVGCEGCSLWVRVGFDVEEG